MLSELKSKQLVWLANEKLADKKSIKTGYEEFDIHYQGLPAQGLIEVQAKKGWGEITFLISYIKTKQEYGCVAIVSPPGILSSEFLLQHGIMLDKLLLINPACDIDALWALEQCLKSGLCSTSIVWGTQLSFKQVRRINLACEQEQASVFFIRESNEVLLPGSQMCIQLQPEIRGLKISVKRQKGKSLRIDPIISFNKLWPYDLPHSGQNISSKSTSFGG